MSEKRTAEQEITTQAIVMALDLARENSKQWAKFKEKYPDATLADFGQADWKWLNEWKTDSHVRVAEYWIKKPITRRLARVQDVDGEHIIDLEDMDDDVRQAVESDGTEIVERHGGRIVVVSKSGEGTTFTIWLPIDGEESGEE